MSWQIESLYGKIQTFRNKKRWKSGKMSCRTRRQTKTEINTAFVSPDNGEMMTQCDNCKSFHLASVNLISVAWRPLAAILVQMVHRLTERSPRKSWGLWKRGLEQWGAHKVWVVKNALKQTCSTVELLKTANLLVRKNVRFSVGSRIFTIIL